MVKLTIRNVNDSIHYELKRLAEENDTSLNDVIISILERAVINKEYIKMETMMINHLNQHTNATNELIQLNRNVYQTLEQQSKLLKKYLE